MTETVKVEYGFVFEDDYVYLLRVGDEQTLIMVRLLDKDSLHYISSQFDVGPSNSYSEIREKAETYALRYPYSGECVYRGTRSRDVLNTTTESDVSVSLLLDAIAGFQKKLTPPPEPIPRFKAIMEEMSRE